MGNRNIVNRVVLPTCNHCGQPFDKGTKNTTRLHCSDRCKNNSAYYKRIKKPWTVPQVRALLEENVYLAETDLENQGLYGDYDDGIQVKGVRIDGHVIRGLTL